MIKIGVWTNRQRFKNLASNSFSRIRLNSVVLSPCTKVLASFFDSDSVIRTCSRTVIAAQFAVLLCLRYLSELNGSDENLVELDSLDLGSTLVQWI